ncbi:MAG: hypothetical protein IJO50_03240 [Clostridia bacterium]|nr:hypothetical protein [Clostridia bacterium]
MNRQDKIFLIDSIKYAFIGLLLVIAPVFVIFLLTAYTGLPFIDTVIAIAATSSIGGMFCMGAVLLWSSVGDIFRIISKYNIVVAIPKGEDNENQKTT